MVATSTQLTPCNKNCIIDPATHYCKGCFRTIEEIIRWQFLNEQERIKILQNVELRKAASSRNSIKTS